MTRRIRYAPPKGPVAISQKALGEEFEVFAGPSGPAFTRQGPYAVITITGPLSQHECWMTDSYDGIRARMEAALGSDAQAVCLRIDSPGGDYAGAMELSRDLRSMSTSARKRLVAFTDSQALSAGYAIASAADPGWIIATDSAALGSIGVWAPLVDLTAQDASMGAKIRIAASGVAKADRNPHVAMTDESFNRLLDQVDEQADLFFDLVSAHRGISVSKIKALGGAELFGQRSVDAGLSDRLVNSWSSFLASEGNPMASKASKYDEAYGLLKQAAEGDDEESAKKAKKALKAMEEGDEEPKKDEDKDKSKSEFPEKDKKESKAADEEKEKEKAKAEEEKKAKAKAEDEKKEKDEARALAANSLALATEVAGLKARETERLLAEAKSKAAAQLEDLFARRPDLSDAQRKALASVPFETAKALVDSWPRVSAAPGSSASAITPRVTGGERRGRDYEPRLSAEEQALLDGSDPARLSAAGPGRAVMQGTTLQIPVFTKEAARARLAEIEAAKKEVA